MSYELVDVSVDDGSPIHLFYFVYEGLDYRFTNVAGGITALGFKWEYKAIGMGEVKSTQEINKNNIDLEFARSDNFSQTVLSVEQNSTTSVTIFRGYELDGDYITYWKGRVAGKAVSSGVIKLECENIYTSLRRPGLNGKLTRMCRHSLYGRGCNLNEDDFKDTHSIDSVSGDGLTIAFSGGTARADNYYTGGMIKTEDGVYRYITSHAGGIVTINRPYENLLVSGVIYIYAGCDRAKSTCINKFDNLLNNGSFPYRKPKNPFGGSSIA